MGVFEEVGDNKEMEWVRVIVVGRKPVMKVLVSVVREGKEECIAKVRARMKEVGMMLERFVMIKDIVMVMEERTAAVDVRVVWAAEERLKVMQMWVRKVWTGMEVRVMAFELWVRVV